MCKHKLALIFSGTVPSYTNEQPGLLVEWQIAENKESLPEKGWPQPCLVSFIFSLGIYYQPLFELFFLCSGIGNRPCSCCDPSCQVATSWCCGSPAKAGSHWFMGRFCCLLGEKEMRGETKFGWGKPVHLYGRTEGERGRVKHWWCRAGVKGVWWVLHSVPSTWSPSLQKAESDVVENLSMVRAPGL